jgi:hypothetical protein
MSQPRFPVVPKLLSFIAGLAGSIVFSTVALAVPIAGFLENWTGTALDGWAGGSTYDNPGTGGVGGAGDGYLRVSTTFNGRLGTFSSGLEYAGDWRAAGITAIKVSLDDVGAGQPLEIHFSIGRRDNLWQYNLGFLPPNESWAEFTVDLTSEANFTRTQGSGTFENALTNVTHVHFRHDLAPYQSLPDPIQADFVIDRLILVGEPTPVAPATWGRLKALYR